jgi:peroxiredoxin
VQPLTEVGVTPPAIKLTNGANAQVALADLTGAHSQSIVVFYRGFF